MQLAKWLCAISIVTLSLTAQAQENPDAKGKASVSYKGRSATPDVKDRALLAAQLKAVDTYYSGLGDAAVENEDAIVDKIKADPDHYFLNTEILDQIDEPSNQRYTVVVRVTLNAARLRIALKQTSNPGKPAPGTLASSIGFIFVTRGTDSRTTYDPRVYKRAETTADGHAQVAMTQSGTEGESVTKSQVATNASVSKAGSARAASTATTETGGSTTLKTDVVTYRILPSEDMSATVNKVFGNAGFMVSEAAFIEPQSGGRLKVSDIQTDFRSGNDLQSATLNNVVAGLRIAKIRYFALATLDCEDATTDAASGLPRVSVTVHARVIDVGLNIPQNVASSGPIQYAAIGQTPDQARTSAVQKAAQATARELTNQLNAAGIH